MYYRPPRTSVYSNKFAYSKVTKSSFLGAGLNDGLFSETMDFRDFPSVLSAVRIAQS